MSNRYFMLILLKQIEAVHGLFNEFLLGKFQKSTEKILKLFKIMNRNFQICLNAFKINMSKFMIHMNCPKKVSLINEKIAQIDKILNNFFPLLLRSCYYIQILEIISQNTPEFEQFIKNYNIILKKYFHEQISLNTHSKRIICQNLLLIMTINIKKQNYEQSKIKFFQATTLIMNILKNLQKKQSKQSKTLKRQLYILIVIGVLNYQKMMAENDQFKGREVGFQILKKIQKQFRLQQSAWSKHIRIQNQINQIIKLNNFQQIKSFILPFITQQSQIIKNITNSNIISIPYSKLYLQSQLKPFKRNSTYKKTIYSIKLNNKQISDTYEHINQKSYLQQDREKRTTQLSKIKLSSRHKNILKNSKFPSIDCFQNNRPSQFLNNVFNDNIQEINRQDYTQSRHSEQKGKEFLTLRLENKSKQTKKIRRKNIKTIISNQTSTFVSNESIYDNALKISKQFVKMKKKQSIINQLISQQRKTEFSQSQIQFFHLSKKKNRNKCDQEQTMKRQKKKQIQKSQMDIFIDILAQNKKRLNINYLIDKYQLTRKRKKTRNYQLEILQLEIQKNLTDFFSFQCTKRSFLGRRNNVSLNSPNTSKKIGWKEDKIKKEEDISKKLQNSHNKSKQVIKQMLKKLTCTSKSKQKIKKISMNCLTEQTFNNKKNDFKQVYL